MPLLPNPHDALLAEAETLAKTFGDGSLFGRLYLATLALVNENDELRQALDAWEATQ